MVINNKHIIGDLVYLKTCPEQQPYIVTGIVVRPNTLLYYLSRGAYESVHYEIEISKDKNLNHIL